METQGEEEGYSPNIFNMKNQVIHEASYNEEYTARDSSIKRKNRGSDEKYDFDDVEEDHNNYDSRGNII